MDIKDVRELANKVVKLVIVVDALSDGLTHSQRAFHDMGHIVNPTEHIGRYEDCAEFSCVEGREMMEKILSIIKEQ